MIDLGVQWRKIWSPIRPRVLETRKVSSRNASLSSLPNWRPNTAATGFVFYHQLAKDRKNRSWRMTRSKVRKPRDYWFRGSEKLPMWVRSVSTFFSRLGRGSKIVTALRPQFNWNDLSKRSEFVAALRQQMSRKRKPTTVLSQEEAEWGVDLSSLFDEGSGVNSGSGREEFGRTGKSPQRKGGRSWKLWCPRALPSSPQYDGGARLIGSIPPGGPSHWSAGL